MASKTYTDWRLAKEAMEMAWGNYHKSLKLVTKVDEWGSTTDGASPVAQMIVDIQYALYKEAKARYEEAKNAHFHKKGA